MYRLFISNRDKKKLFLLSLKPKCIGLYSYDYVRAISFIFLQTTYGFLCLL